MSDDSGTNGDSAASRRFLSLRDRQNIAWFWHGYLKERARWVVLILLLVLSQGFVYQQFLRLTEDGLRLIFERGSVRELILVCITVFVVIGYRGLMSFLVPRLSVWIAADAVMKLRGHLIDHLLGLDLTFFERRSPGESILRLTNQAEALSSFVGQSLVRALRDFFTIVILGAYLLWKQPVLFAGAALVLPVIILLMQIVTRRIKSAQALNQAAMRDYISALEETLYAMRTVKFSGQETVERDRLRDHAQSLRARTIEVQSYNAMAMPFVDFAAALAYALVIGGGGYMVLSPDFDMDGAAIVAFMIGLVLIFDPGRRLAQFLTGFQTNLVVLDIVRRQFDEVATIADRAGATEDFDASGDIAFHGVHYAYSDDQPLFRGLDLTFEGGKTTAIVGPTGSGKTTVLSLLGRLYEPSEGEISIGGKPIRDIALKPLRAAFSVVAQDIVIFDNSVWENIRYVRPEATEADIWAAAEAAEIADLIRARGDAPVGPKGAQLSGGQRQRIAIARAFLRDAPIVLLDEATSALDQATEERVKAALDRLSSGRTTIVVAHRLSSVSDADRIYVLEAGRVAEAGAHEDLVRADGLYAQLFKAQRDGYAPRDQASSATDE